MKDSQRIARSDSSGKYFLRLVSKFFADVILVDAKSDHQFSGKGKSIEFQADAIQILRKFFVNYFSSAQTRVPEPTYISELVYLTLRISFPSFVYHLGGKMPS